MNHRHIRNDKNKQAASTVAASVSSILLSIIASSHHWLHVGILFVLGGSANMMVTMSGVLWLRRAMLLATLLTSVYSVYRLYVHKQMPIWMKGMTFLSVIISLGFILSTLFRFGW
ncbi:hypothetical protein [Paenibacillus beijingensis]|uniref:Uncharacterized protein n=1 Tax=Paenibacillus beijingensis TaxID=1126833 RepID=A0A0D5NNZ0_9BACL|nr:hypothetical protein [Paenibacillus beijingensis]AJY76880.1 hypothetical protein VN24_22850 [Paenibacillus beijingensis]